MTPAQARAAISETFAAGWGSATPIVCDDTLPDTQGQPWVRFTVQHGEAQSRTGRKINTYVSGAATAAIHTAIGTDNALVDQLVDHAKTILRDRDLAGGIDLYNDGVVNDGHNGHGWLVVRVRSVFIHRS